jgi:hypothetical protein
MPGMDEKDDAPPKPAGSEGRPAADAPKPPPNPDPTPDAKPAPKPREIGGPKGPEPTRYGDWEQKGRCTDF